MLAPKRVSFGPNKKSDSVGWKMIWLLGYHCFRCRVSFRDGNYCSVIAPVSEMTSSLAASCFQSHINAKLRLKRYFEGAILIFGRCMNIICIHPPMKISPSFPSLWLKGNASYTSSARTSRGRKFPREKLYISQRKNLPIECAQGDRPARCPNHFFAVPWW